MTPYFNYELTAIPTFLFKDYAVHKTATAQLTKVLMSNAQQSECNTQLHYVLDGGALIHRVKWQKRSRSHIQRNTLKLIFYGYKQGPSIKDHEHQRRFKKICTDI